MKQSTKTALLWIVAITAWITALCSVLTGCELPPNAGAEHGLLDGGTPEACEGATLEAPERTGQAGTVDGAPVFLRSQEGLHSSAEILSTIDYRHCPVCLTNPYVACARHWEDADCNLLPARTIIPCEDPTNVIATPTGMRATCNGQAIEVQLPDVCGCDEPSGVSGSVILCPNGDAWEVATFLF